jgi:DNA-directed RNA polymerase subunit N (RpoN/RPB10)
MLIPVRCFTCGTVLGDKYEYYLREIGAGKTPSATPPVQYITSDTREKTIEGKVMDKLNLRKMCCRRHMLTHVNIM